MTKILENNTLNKEIDTPKQTTMTSKIPTDEKILFSEASLKEILAKPEVQSALKKHLSVPENVIIKELRKSYTDEKTGIATQKVEAVSGTSLVDMVSLSFTLVEIELDPVTSINKTFRIVDYTFAPQANMSGKTFNGYAHKGFKLLVTHIEELKEGEQK